jgi:hypothetical protein
MIANPPNFSELVKDLDRIEQQHKEKTMKKLILQRVSENADTTFGVFIDGSTGFPICLSIENKWRDNKPNVSCVPTGKYACRKVTSSKVKHFNNGMSYRLDMEEMNKVYREPRNYIDIHLGNAHHDTLGCILPVRWFGSVVVGDLQDVEGGLDSSGAFVNLMSHLDGEEEFQLEIKGICHA